MDAEEHLATDELPVGYSFGQYEILGSIGVGGMARVYRARHIESGSLVALKVMERALLRSAASRRRFLREGATAAAVKHANVVGMLEVGSWKELPFIAMELLSGLDLDSYIQKRGPLPESDVVALALPIVAGMSAVHRAGVVHRDIKPSNIFLATGESGLAAPKLLDFGISKIHGSMLDTDTRTTGSREIIGTPAYLAPEALNGSRQLGPRSDQYSLGVVLYECVVGRSPYAGLTLLQLLQALAAGVVQAPGKVRLDVTAELDAIICRMMATKSSDRFEDIDAVGRALWLRAEEPARAIWASQFGEAGYTAPILGSTSPPVGMTTHGMTLRSLTPVLIEPPSKPAKWRSAILTGVALLTLFVGVFLVSRYSLRGENDGLEALAVPSAAARAMVAADEGVAVQDEAGSQNVAVAVGRLPRRAAQPLANDSAVLSERLAADAARENNSGAANEGSSALGSEATDDQQGSTGVRKGARVASRKVNRGSQRLGKKSKRAKSRRRARRSSREEARKASRLQAADRSSKKKDLSTQAGGDVDLPRMFDPTKEQPRKQRSQRVSKVGTNDSPILD